MVTSDFHVLNDKEIQIPRVCVSCPNKTCMKGAVRKMTMCEYGVSYFREADALHRLDQPIPLRNLAQNLKHETHKFLQLIVNDACEIDPGISTKTVDLANPASRIVAATVLINEFVDMIAGVNDFTPPRGAFATRQSGQLLVMIDKSIKAQSLVKNNRRCKRLTFLRTFDEPDIEVVTGARAIESIISVIIDNVYKYSVEGTTVKINSSRDQAGLGVISVSNVCLSLLEPNRAFAKGYQSDPASDGFGYGLYWAHMIIAYMNEQLKSELEIDLKSAPATDGLFICTLSLKGLPCG